MTRKEARERRKAAESENRRLKAAQKDAPDEDASAKDVEKWQGVVKRQAARAALAEAGVVKEKIARALGFTAVGAAVRAEQAQAERRGSAQPGGDSATA